MNSDFYFKRSHERYAAKDYVGGDADMDQAILLAPDNLEYRRTRGKFRYQAEEYQLAVEDYSKIAELSTDTEDLQQAYHLLAISHEVLGLTDELLADLDWLIEHKLAEANIYTWRGQHKYRLGDFEAALEDFTAALELAPGTTNYLLVRANAYTQLKRFEDAVEDLTVVLSSESHPKFLETVYMKRASAYFRMNKHEQAFADFNESIRLGGGQSFTSAAAYFAAYPDGL